MQESKKKTVKVTRSFSFDRKVVPAGTVATYDQSFADELIHNGKAIVFANQAETETAEPAKKDKGERHAK